MASPAVIDGSDQIIDKPENFGRNAAESSADLL